MTGKLLSEVRIVTLPPMQVACCRVVSATPEIDAWQRMQGWAEQHGLAGAVRNFGFDTAASVEQQPGDPQPAGLRGYELWFVLEPPLEPAAAQAWEDDAPPEVRVRSFAGGLYAQMTIYDPFVDPFARIPAGWSRLHQWVADHRQYEAAEHQCLEEAVEEDGQRNLVLYYPVAAIAEGEPA